MTKVFQAQLLLCVVTCATASEQPLVQCASSVHVKFVVTPQQLQPEFNEEMRLGQKHWSAYNCKMNLAALDAESIAKVRQLKSTNNSLDDDTNETDTNSDAIENVTETTTVSTTVASTTTTTSSTTTNSSTNLSDPNQTVNAELGGARCWKTWTTGLLSLGLSLSLPVAEAAPGAFRVPSQPQKLKDLTEVVEVLMPCSALFDPLMDLDGDGALDCKVTQEQNLIAESVPAIGGTWHVLSAQSVSSGTLGVESHHSKSSITIGGGAWCVNLGVDPSARWEDKLEELVKEQLPLALTRVVSFTHDAKPCSSEMDCEASMWSFDLAYPASSCAPGVAGWIQPCTAKLLPDGTLVLLRGAPVQSGSNAGRPPLMAAVIDVTDALPFANGVAAGTPSSLEVLLLHKHRSLISSESSRVLSMARQVSNAEVLGTSAAWRALAMSIAEGRQLQSSSNDTSAEDDNEVSTTTTSSSTTTSDNTDLREDLNETVDNTTTTTTTITTTSTTTTTANLTDLNKTVNAEIAQARGLRVWSTALLCFALRCLVR